MDNRLEGFLLNLVGLVIAVVIIVFGVAYFEKDVPKITNAKPISQQQIGDDTNPDILIIYEAEVDGETVYPTVIYKSE